jgi:hypothetical protein
MGPHLPVETPVAVLAGGNKYIIINIVVVFVFVVGEPG